MTKQQHTHTHTRSDRESDTVSNCTTLTALDSQQSTSQGELIPKVES
jgi:hypothetical protein